MRSVGFKSFACGFAVGLCVLATGPSAFAAKLVFDIQVTQKSNDPSFTPLNFQQTWTFEPTPRTRPLASDPPILLQHLSFPNGAAAENTTSPVTDAVVAASGYATLDGVGGFAWGTSRTTLVNDVPTVTNFSFSLDRQMLDETPLGDGRILHRYYDTNISGFFTLPTPDTRVMTADVFADLLESVGPLRWFEGGFFSIETPGATGSTFQEISNLNYVGTATLNRALSVVPEPGTWALLILGFAGAGTALRRRQSTSASPEPSTRKP